MSGLPPATTPARLTRSRANTPLPNLQLRQSHAYGAAGKASLLGQVTQSQAEVDQAFSNTRQVRETATPPAAQRPRRGRKPKLQSHISEVVDEESAINPSGNSTQKQPSTRRNNRTNDLMNGDDDRPETALQDSANYDSPTPPPPSPTPPPPASPPADPETHYEPGYLRLCWRTFRRWLPSFQLMVFTLFSWGILIGYFCLFMTIAAWIPVPAEMESRRDEFFYGLRHAFGVDRVPPWKVDELWLRARHAKLFESEIPPYEVPNLQWLVNRNLLGRVQDLENATAVLETQLGLANETILEVRRILPMSVAVIEENGKLVVPPAFWQALLQKMQSPDASPLWESFIRSNKAQMHSATSEVVEDVVGSHMETFAQTHKFVSKDEFQQAIIDNNQYMEENFSERLRSFQAHVVHESTRAAVDAVEKLPAAQLAKNQLEALAYSNLVQNMDRRLRETNYFSIGLGALVDPQYTSHTFNAPNWIQRLGHRVAWMAGFSAIKLPPIPPNPPAAALLSWEESTECWCAASSEDEKTKAQLTVKMAHSIYPKDLVIEHIPSSGTRDIQAAPQEFEVWAQVDSAEEAQRIKMQLDQRVEYYYQFECGAPPKDEKSWVCVYAGKYDIHALNYVQVYTLHTDAQGIGLHTNKIAMRVTKNWGADHTCLYRVRMTGDEEGPQVGWTSREDEL